MLPHECVKAVGTSGCVSVAECQWDLSSNSDQKTLRADSAPPGTTGSAEKGVWVEGAKSRAACGEQRGWGVAH